MFITRLRIWIHRLLATIRRRRLERDLDAEIQSHIEMGAEDNLRQGMNADDARLSAMREFGGVDQAKERYRDFRGIPFFESLFQDTRFAFRTLRRNPAFTVV